jgi:hypothetical protein
MNCDFSSVSALMLTMQRHPRDFPVRAKSVFDGGVLIK